MSERHHIDSCYRYAIYATPEANTPLGRFGNAWLGRDPEANVLLSPPLLPGYTHEDIAHLTSTPTRYGFHATLKPPFRLKEGTSPDMLFNALDEVCGAASPIVADGFKVTSLGSFIAIVPSPPVPALDDLARRLVQEMDVFREPLSPEEMAKRRNTPLTPRQDELLKLWGYPYVLDEFRFHFTLTNSLEKSVLHELVTDLSAYTSNIVGPYTFNSVAVFGEVTKGAPFTLLKRFQLG